MDYSDKEQESITVINSIAQIFIHGYPEQIQSDNGIDLKARFLMLI